MPGVLIEAESIPYEPAQLRGERLLVLAPHPDDEVIGCGGLIAQHLRDRRSVRVVVVADGGAAGDVAIREDECRRGLTRLGNAELDFLRLPDRGVGDEAAPRIREHLLEFRPDLVLVPSPVEIHPDHAALSRVFCELIQRDATLFADLAVARVAFYEVSQPLRPNTIVDISDVAEEKYAAIAEHASQLALRDYVAFARGLNAYRAMTLPPGTKFAEALYVIDLPSLRMTPLSELRRAVGAPREIVTLRETLPVSVVIRTKDRPVLLEEAIGSVRATEYPCEIVVVNDGGARVEPEGVTLIEHERPRGRAEAANAGVRAASNRFIVFLDDDDIFHPEHLVTLTNAAESGHVAWYSDAVSAFLRPGASGVYETRSRMRLFSQDYDRELLLIDNYIPLPTLLVARETFLDLGGFDPDFDLFEDWDFLIRLAQRGDFLHIPRVTCEIRHFEGGSSVVLASPEGTEKFRAAKLKIWQKHAAQIDQHVVANVFERQKRRATAIYSDLIEAKGQVDEAYRTIARLEREKAETLDRLPPLYESINGHALRVRELEGALKSIEHLRVDYERKTIEVERVNREIEAMRAQIEAMHGENDSLRGANAQIHDALERTRVEVARLQGLLDMIYRSRTWKVHTLVEKMKGRG